MSDDPPPPSLLNDAKFRRFASAALLGSLSLRIWLFCVPVLAVLVLHADEFQVGLLTALSATAAVLFSLPAGVLLDRGSAKALLIAAVLARAALGLFVPALWYLGWLSFWALAGVVFSVTVVNVLYETARQSLLPVLVGRERIVEGNSKLEGINQTTVLLGPSLGGQLVGLLAAPAAVLVSAAASVATAIPLFRLRVAEKVRDRKRDRSSFWSDIHEGFSFVIKHPVLRWIASSNLIANFVMAMQGALNFLYLARELNASPAFIGVVYTVSGVGGITAAATARGIAQRLGHGPTLTSAMLLLPACFATLPLITSSDWLLLAGLSGAATGFIAIVYNVAQISTRQLLAPDELLGRVNATFRFLNGLLAPFGALAAGAIASIIGTREALFIAAATALLGGLLLLLSPNRKTKNFSQTDRVPHAA